MLSQLMARGVFILGLIAGTLSAQHRVSPEHLGHKVWAVVPLVGTGKPDDPKRPLFIPSPTQSAALAAAAQGQKVTQAPDLLGYTMQLSDDGKAALVEFTFSSPVAFHNFMVRAAAQPGVNAANSEKEVDLDKLHKGDTDGSEIRDLAASTAKVQTALQTAVPTLRMFERGKTTQGEILAEFRKHKANYQFNGEIKAANSGVAQ